MRAAKQEHRGARQAHHCILLGRQVHHCLLVRPNTRASLPRREASASVHYVEQAVHHGLLMSRTWAATPRAPAACICLLFIPCEIMWPELQRSILKPREEDALLGRSLNILIASGWQLFLTMASSVGKAVDDFMLMLRSRHLEYCHLRQLDALRIIPQRINDKHWCDHCHHLGLSE